MIDVDKLPKEDESFWRGFVGYDFTMHCEYEDGEEETIDFPENFWINWGNICSEDFPVTNIAIEVEKYKKVIKEQEELGITDISFCFSFSDSHGDVASRHFSPVKIVKRNNDNYIVFELIKD